MYSFFKKKKQDPATVVILMPDWLEEIVREKDELRFATAEYGEQCATMAGIKWMPLLSADNWVTKELCPPTTAVLEMGKVQYY